MTEGTQPNIDYDQLAAAIKRSDAPAATAPGGSIYQQKLQELLSNPENNRESVEQIHSLIEAKAAEVQSTAQVRANYDRAVSLLVSEIEAVTSADEELGKYAKAVELLVGQEFQNTTKDGQERLQKVLNGTLSKDDMKALVRKHFNELAGAEAKQGKGALTGMKTEVNGQNAANQKTENVPQTVSELNEPQRELYYSIKAEHERIGLKQLGMSEQQVHELAMKRASGKFKEGRVL